MRAGRREPRVAAIATARPTRRTQVVAACQLPVDVAGALRELHVLRRGGIRVAAPARLVTLEREVRLALCAALTVAFPDGRYLRVRCAEVAVATALVAANVRPGGVWSLGADDTASVPPVPAAAAAARIQLHIEGDAEVARNLWTSCLHQ